MSGIYIHIPFCRKACHYCNFHFSTNLNNVNELVNAICKDIELRSNFLVDKNLNSIYFGGGTPSVLNEDHLKQIMNVIGNNFILTENMEITFESNPDDLSVSYLEMLKRNRINRLSIGVQSFFEEDLIFMNRSHNAKQSLESINIAQHMGFDNITIDLIYGSNTTTNEMWRQNVEQALSLNIPHISSYCLTIEEKTAFHDWTIKGKMQTPNEEKANEQFDYLINVLTENGYDHYEISNFGKPGSHAKHNTNYWRGVHYLGVGPSAHSYNGEKRTWVKANNIEYIKSLVENRIPIEEELLTLNDKFNEYMMTGLRTMWGIDLLKVKTDFGNEFYESVINNLNEEWIKEKITQKENILTLTQEGKSFADRIASHFFIVE